MEIRLKTREFFDLDATLCCGQAFRWSWQDGWWYGIVKGKVFKIRQINDRIEFTNADASFVRDYFGLNDDLPKILQKICKDPHIKAAINKFKGLRILRQEPWECLISYICATYKNISAVRQMLFNISKKFGEKIRFEGKTFYTFPTAGRLARATLEELAQCGLGYRAKYASATAKMVYEDKFEFDHLRKMTYEKAREELMRFSGVGSKVADCTLLFSLEKLEAFPVDVWIKRVILRHYANHFPSDFVAKVSCKKSPTPFEYEKLSQFGQKYFGEYAGYAQEYLYHYERVHS